MIALRWVTDRGLHRGALTGIVCGNMALAAAVGAAVLAYVALTGGSDSDLLLSFGINAILVVGLQSFVGNTGVMSFAPMAFMGVGAYAAGIAAVPPMAKARMLPDLPVFLQDLALPLAPAMLVGGGAAALLALLSGLVLMRLTGIAAGITSLGVLMIVNELLRNAEAFTRGSRTFFGVPASADLPWVFGTLVAAMGLAMLLKASSIGLRARAVRDDALAAATAGINPVTARLWPYIVFGFLSGVAGALWAHHLTAFSPNSFFVAQTIPIIVMLVVGGTGSVAGGLVGAMVLTAWLELIRPIEAGAFGIADLNGLALLSVGVGLIVLLLLRPHGILGAREPQFVKRHAQLGPSRRRGRLGAVRREREEGR